MHRAIKSIEIKRLSNGHASIVSDDLSIEEPLEIGLFLNSSNAEQPVSVTMRTPGNDDELAVGFLFTEGIITNWNEVVEIRDNGLNKISVALRSDVLVDAKLLSRNFYTTSSCGVCGKSSIDAIPSAIAVTGNDFAIPANVLEALPQKLQSNQSNFQTTGGIHASALFDLSGNLIVVREDVGRHNALDKVIGNQIMNGNIPLRHSILLVSGRASFELLQKATRAGIGLVAAIGAPSSLAVELATQKGITLVGFLKANRFNIYAHPQRITT